MPTTARLYTPAGGWGMPTISAEGLSAHALLRFAGIPYSSLSSSSTSPTAPPTILLSSPTNETITGLATLVGLLSSAPGLRDPNAHLTPFMLSESTAYLSLLQTRLTPALLFNLYISPSNYADIHHTILAPSHTFPLSRILPYMHRREVRTAVASKTPAETYFDAGIALNALSTRLGEKPYFYGSKPAVLDAVVFGHLAPVIFAPLPETRLRDIVALQPNLVQFVARIKKDYFPEDGGEWGPDLDAEEVKRFREEAAKREAAEQREERVRRGEERAREAKEGERVKSDRADKVESEDEKRERHNWYFLGGSAAVFAAHLLLGSEIEMEMGGE